ncbi:ABC transporter substrate-binding protein [Paenibacillus sp. SYP-B3998]|uniref:ABC transporter substrate-binding protein n=1 Tax=Paenibacillus sp. SYP-B3998 TaxID=2678564 RepID=A0A6G3ZVM7_9BACL|nr:ABC transporter substrate-binding protein [Paenibacillus sp. SYP-B3998]NEW06276.1 ABC transporter substrate-binding protein [Paenibacillus sp. SYP-B3998]
MPKMKKTLQMVTVSSLLLVLPLSACGSKDTATTGASVAPATTAGAKADPAKGTVDPSKLKPYEIVWYHDGGEVPDSDKVFEKVSEYTKQKINATVKFKMVNWGDYDSKMQTIIASGEKFDIAFTASWAANYRENALKGAFIPVDDLLQKYGQDLLKVLDKRFLEGTKVNGKNYAIPVQKEIAQQYVWRFNKNLVDKYKLDVTKVKSLEDMEPLLKSVKEGEKIAPLQASYDSNVFYIPYDYLLEQTIPIGVKLDTKDFKFVNVYETPEFQKAAETMHKYYQEGYILKDAATRKGGEDIKKSGKWLIDRQATVPGADNIWTKQYAMPIVSTPIEQPVVLNGSVSGAMHAISATSQDPERVMMFENLLNTDPYLQNLVSYGLEGTHYKKLDEHTIQDLPARSERYNMPLFGLGNRFITFLDKDDAKDKWDQYKKFNESSYKAPTLGFAFDPEPVKNELAAVRSAANEFNFALWTGSVDPKEFLPKAIDKYKAVGIDKIVNEAQKQFDAWKATQK